MIELSVSNTMQKKIVNINFRIGIFEKKYSSFLFYEAGVVFKNNIICKYIIDIWFIVVRGTRFAIWAIIYQIIIAIKGGYS